VSSQQQHLLLSTENGTSSAVVGLRLALRCSRCRKRWESAPVAKQMLFVQNVSAEAEQSGQDARGPQTAAAM